QLSQLRRYAGVAPPDERGPRPPRAVGGGPDGPSAFRCCAVRAVRASDRRAALPGAAALALRPRPPQGRLRPRGRRSVSLPGGSPDSGPSAREARPARPHTSPPPGGGAHHHRLITAVRQLSGDSVHQATVRRSVRRPMIAVPPGHSISHNPLRPAPHLVMDLDGAGPRIRRATVTLVDLDGRDVLDERGCGRR